MTKIVIIGGVAGGATTAARLRRLDEKAEIILFERGEHVSYANCGLPYYVGGAISDRSRLFVMTPELFRSTLGVDVRVRQEVMSINTERRTVEVRDHANGATYHESFDSLVLSPGAEPIRPRIPGIEDSRIFTVRSVPDIDKVKEFVDARRPQRAVIIGGGFIGLEMAENLHERGVFATIVEAQDQVMAAVDFEMASIVHHHIASKNVELYLKDAVASFIRNDDDRIVVRLQSGKELPCDMVILSIGVKPDTHLAKDAGITLDERGYIQVDSRMRTNIPGIFAVGDAITVDNPLLAHKAPIPLAGPANKQARIAADNILLGDKAPQYKGAIATAVAKVFDMTVAATGLSEKVCVREKIDHQAVIVHPSHHAGYYPGAKPLTLKLIFRPQDGRILGAQAVGYDGVDKRIDVIAAYIGMRGTTHDLEEFEQAYAPPFSSAKDAVNHVGFIASNLLQGLSRQVHWHEIPALVKGGAYLLDVRTPEEFALGHIEGANNISNLDLRNRLSDVPRNRLVVVYCGVGIRGYLAERILMQNGFTDVANLAGGFKTYESALAPQSNEDVYRPHAVATTPRVQSPVPFNEGSGMPQPLANVSKEVVVVDACGLQCPGPIMQLKQSMDKALPGTRLLVRATDGGFVKDAKSWCNLTGNLLVSIENNAGVYEAVIEKTPPALVDVRNGTPGVNVTVQGNEVSLVIFSNDLDRALASFVIANGAAASGKKVTMFFTFWGLSIIRKPEKVKVEKDFVSKVFDAMLPSNARKLALSKMNFWGAGAKLMRSRMEKKSVEQLEGMMESARKNGVQMTACLMSMDIMGVAREEIIDGIEIGGVASYLEAASRSNINLFV